MHNLRYYQRLMAGLRQAIAGRTLGAFVAEFYARRQGAVVS
jgi:queuine tRNA-ribosyltransferase